MCIVSIPGNGRPAPQVAITEREHFLALHNGSLIDPPSRLRTRAVSFPTPPTPPTSAVDVREVPESNAAGATDAAAPTRSRLRLCCRRLWATAAYLSLAICFAAGVFWARSLLSGEGIVLRRGHIQYSLSSTEGTLIYVHQRLHFDSAQTERIWRTIDPTANATWDRWTLYLLSDANVPPPLPDTGLGFGNDNSSGVAGRRLGLSGVQWRRRIIQLPHWSVMIVTAILPAFHLSRIYRLRRRRADLGLCRKCGFDLGEVYHSCPVCGERVPVSGFPIK